MKNKINFIMNYIMSPNTTIIRKIFICSLLLIGIATISMAQVTQRPQPKFWFGASAAANFNFYDGTTQTLNASTKAPTAFKKGFGVGPYASLFLEYRPKPVWGLMLNIAYDDLSAKFDGEIAPCNCPEALTVKTTYIAIEPSLRIAPFSSGFYMFVGGVIRSNIDKSFTYTQKLQPDVKGDLSDMQSMIYSGQVGMGYDIPISPVSKRTQWQLSPFVAYHPYFGQAPRGSFESWSIQTVRTGIALKFGMARAAAVAKVPKGAPIVAATVFTIQAPLPVPAKRKINETFPIRDYVFFDIGSSEIPDRYVKLNKEQARSFKEEQLREPEPKDLAGRSQRQLAVYHNILNILGARMKDNPNTTITLIGSSAGDGPELGKTYAESIKHYLVDVFGINGARISVEGRNQPVIPSEQPGGKTDLVLLREGDRRVDIVCNSTVLLRPLQIEAIQEDPLDSRVIFKTQVGDNESLKSWSLEIKDENGIVQNFGPYTKSEESISGNAILGSREEGTYNVVMLGETKDGNMIRKESTLHLVHNIAPAEEALRFSILFDFDKSKTVASYEKFLTENVAPLISDNSTVIIHGHTDIIGDEDHNMNLSLQRSRDAQNILQRAVTKAGKQGVKFEVDGFGADTNAAPFENKLPEERFYNRTVIIDIVPAK
jgi:outer membrane protein OmpA-like peptidoglycan-associated protein